MVSSIVVSELKVKIKYRYRFRLIRKHIDYRYLVQVPDYRFTGKYWYRYLTLDNQNLIVHS
jgi:hypothetical protein